MVDGGDIPLGAVTVPANRHGPTLTASFSVNDPQRMMHMCGLIEGSVRLVLVPLICGQVSILATRCKPSLAYPSVPDWGYAMFTGDRYEKFESFLS